MPALIVVAFVGGSLVPRGHPDQGYVAFVIALAAAAVFEHIWTRR